MSASIRLAVITAAVTMLTVGCSASPPTSVDPAPDNVVSDAPADENATEPSPEPIVALLNDEWTDSDGYSYAFALQTAEGTATKDVANAKPGEAKVSYEYTFGGTMENKTLNRNAPSPVIFVQPVWSADNLICSVGGQSVRDAFASNVDGFDERWCTLSSFPSLFIADAVDIPMGATLQTRTGGNSSTLVVEEADADAISAELRAPTLWATARRLDSTGGLLTTCLMKTGGYYLSQATAETGCAP